MILQWKSRGPVLLVATLLLAAGPVWCQEEAGEEEARPEHTLNLDIEHWIATPSGLGYSPSTVANTVVSVANEVLGTQFDTETAYVYGIGYKLPGDNGRLVGRWQSLGFDTDETTLSPGEYIYAQTLSFPDFAGVNDDGMADGFLYSTSTTLREWYVGYERRAFRTQRVSGRWTLGWRRSTHRRNQDVIYFANISPLPPLLPPTANCSGVSEPVDDGVLLNCTLSPRPDTASLGSTFDARGPMVRLDVDFNLWRDKLILETGAAFTVIRGEMDADYVGVNSFYYCNEDAVDYLTGAGCEQDEIINAPWDQLNQFVVPSPGADPIQVSTVVAQDSLPAGVSTSSEETSSNVVDVLIGFRWHVFDWFDVTGGFRSSRYDDVGLNLIPVQVSESISGAVGVPEMEAKRTSVTYEGFYVGLSFSVF